MDTAIGALRLRSEVPEGSRRKQSARSGDKVEIDFGVELLEVLLFLGGFARLDELAQLAGMLAVKSLLERDGDGLGLGVSDSHAQPGRRLQQEPMSADQQDQREHGAPFAATPEHTGIMGPGRNLSTRGRRLRGNPRYFTVSTSTRRP
jgi:hypothetical protein